MRMQIKDPVCGMLVDSEDEDVPQQQYEGHGYYFCSETCKQEFLDHPDRYRNKLAS
jgi:YHS domain-containing protein